MTSSRSTAAEAPPGWYTDPAGSNAERYWDGAEWTDRLRPPLARGSNGRAEDRQGSPEDRSETEESRLPAESGLSLLGELRRGRLLLGWLVIVGLAQLAVALGVLVYLAIDPSQSRGWVAALCGIGALIAVACAGLLVRRSIR